MLTGFLIFLAPVSCAAGINLFAGLGSDFHSPTATVVLVTGGGAAIASGIGSLFGGYLADRVRRSVLYVGAGLLIGCCSLALAIAPHTQTGFAIGVIIYNGIAGVCYAAFTALGLELVGSGNATAATQLGLFAAATNGAISYMTWFDGQGYRLGGVRGLLLVDGLAAVGAGIPLLVFVGRRMQPTRAVIDAQTSSAGGFSS